MAGQIWGQWFCGGSARLRQLRAVVLAMVFVLAEAVPSQAIVMRHDVPEQDYVSLAASFGAVGRISSSSISSGTLVSSTKFLTAAHSVDSNRDGVLDNALNTYALRFGANVGSPDYTINALASISIHPQWGLTGGNRTYDLAVVTLTNPLTQITPIGLSDLDPAGLTGTMVGYGLHGTGDNFVGVLDGIRRAATNVVDLTSPTVRTDFDSPAQNTNVYGSAVPLALEGTTAPGDSGGPLLVDFGSGPRIIGVLSGGSSPIGDDMEYGDVSIYAPINNAVNIDYLATQGIAVPEPSSLALFAAGLAIAAHLRSRSRASPAPEGTGGDGFAAKVMLGAVDISQKNQSPHRKVVANP
jgi:hypothetical protein